MIKNKKTKFIHLGLIDYQEAWDYQKRLFHSVIDQKLKNRTLATTEQTPPDNYLVFCHHPHVYTLGKSGKETHLLLNDAQLAGRQAQYYKIDRGGDITYHGPGQIVGYPILDLENFFTDIHLYLRQLEEAVIRTLGDYEIGAGRIPGLTGVWVGHESPATARKICAFGVKSSRWVTMHGLALNVKVDLDYFSQIIPCGIQDKAVTSMDRELNSDLDLPQVEARLKEHIAELFEMELT